MITPAIASINAKIASLNDLRDSIEGGHFRSAISTIMGCEGKLVISGIGKSGHIGRKIAATLMSTGQRASFLHPAEASHGDMGMIDPYVDNILMISNSGATEELYPVAAYAKKNHIPVIVITSRPESELAGIAHCVLLTPRTAEGCPIGIAPMASAVAQMAIGDALAAELMVKRGFGAKDFANLHHGGYLGRAKV